MSDLTTDVVIVGGGPAGLGAALALGRAVKQVVLCDGGVRRNAAAEHMHGFVTRDGVPPSEFRRIAREQLRPYAVTTKDVGVARIESTARGGFDVTLADGTHVSCRRVLLALGLVDDLPDLRGLRESWGRGSFSCPYCHGWEARLAPWGILAAEAADLEYAIFLTGWSKDVVAFTNGPMEIARDVRARLDRAGVRLDARRVRGLVVGPDGRLTAVEMEDGATVPRAAMVVRPRQRQTDLVLELGLELDARGLVRTDENAQTSTPGIHAAGDLAGPMQAAIFAAAAGTRAAYLLNYLMNVQSDERAPTSAPFAQESGLAVRGRIAELAP